MLPNLLYLGLGRLFVALEPGWAHGRVIRPIAGCGFVYLPLKPLKYLVSPQTAVGSKSNSFCYSSSLFPI